MAYAGAASWRRCGWRTTARPHVRRAIRAVNVEGIGIIEDSSPLLSEKVRLALRNGTRAVPPARRPGDPPYPARPSSLCACCCPPPPPASSPAPRRVECCPRSQAPVSRSVTLVPHYSHPARDEAGVPDVIRRRTRWERLNTRGGMICDRQASVALSLSSLSTSFYSLILLSLITRSHSVRQHPRRRRNSHQLHPYPPRLPRRLSSRLPSLRSTPPTQAMATTPPSVLMQSDLTPGAYSGPLPSVLAPAHSFSRSPSPRRAAKITRSPPLPLPATQLVEVKTEPSSTSCASSASSSTSSPSKPKAARKLKSRGPDYQPRPPNAWILYRSAQLKVLKEDIALGSKPQSEICKPSINRFPSCAAIHVARLASSRAFAGVGPVGTAELTLS